ncbi:MULTISPECIES: TVP38/TMEM64 family protein [Planococcus]|uniref:TVP38/TMEM64 family membrane protein n=1 Tax=Planococcus faecalis TaxID=1598147 RepID=A0ABM6ITR9_9BACL|nr:MULTISPECIES: TVP38/TMEM64 family protein [Planococcus]AQU79314.1 TVP38/TMEM64 family protein [Planococcus faecalis]KAA0955167.1 TVP38/TMEM64 family protein [Planococcus sp. ANT_H30]MDJ0333494.1 TVP38/TMEM64 family protein [Planococcus sp. S3-L1]OHX53905.1 SNARE associated Golgi family protein [Planococcus faecalis]
MSKSRALQIAKWLLIAVAVGLVIWLSRSVFQVDANDLRKWILSFGLWSPVIYILIYTVRPLIFFPASILSIAGGLAFGAWLGTLYTIIGATLGAMLSFYVAKTLGNKLVRKTWTGNVRKIQSQMEQNGFFYVLLFRFIPVINFDLISYVAAFAKVRFTSFALATFIGIIPGTFAYNFLGSSFVSGNPKIIILAVVVFVIMTVVPITLRNRWNKKQLLDK